MKYKRLLLFTLVTTLLLVLSMDQPVHAGLVAGTLDTGFDPGTGANGIVWAAAQQKDGRIMIAGDFTSVNGEWREKIARVYADGTVDYSFLPSTGANGPIYSMAVQNDGKIVIGGNFTTYRGVARNHIARINPDGSLDTTFKPGTGANGDVNEVALLSDGRIMIGGDFTKYNLSTRNYVARLHSNGSLDTSFNTFPAVDGEVETLHLISGDRVYIGGHFNNVGGVSRNGIAMLRANGTLETSFDPGNGADGIVYDLDATRIEEVVIVGDFTTVGKDTRNRVAWLEQDGTLSKTFEPILGADNTVRTVVMGYGDKPIIGGLFTTVEGVSRSRIARMNTDGSADTSFDPGTGANNPVYDLSTQNDGKVLVAGGFTLMDNVAHYRITRLAADGSLDTGLDAGAGPNIEPVNIVLTTTDEKMIIGGAFREFDGVDCDYYTRLNADGSVDSSFCNDEPNGIVTESAMQADGKFILAGDFTTVGGNSRNRIARFTEDGYIDTTFSVGGGPDDEVLVIAIQENGKILIGGQFHDYNGTTRNHIARINEDGSIDTTFDPGAGPTDYVYGIAIQEDSKIILVGSFAGFNGAAYGIVRLNYTGTRDTTFITGNYFNGYIYAVGIQSDGKIIVSGSFTDYDGTPVNGIARLNTDGTLDTSFMIGTGLDGSAAKILIQPDDKIMLIGGFTTYNGVPRNHIARLNANGTLDTGFIPVSGPDSLIKDITLQPGGKFVIAGWFDNYDGEVNENVARLNGGEAPYLDLSSAPPPGEVGVSYDGMYTYEASGFPTPRFYIMSGELPPGIELNTWTGELHGTPTMVGYFPVEVAAYNYIYPSSSVLYEFNIGHPVYLPLVLR